MTGPGSRPLPPRRFILAAAIILALSFWLVARVTVVHAQGSARTAAVPAAPAASPSSAARAPTAAASEAAPDHPRAKATVIIGADGAKITVDKPDDAAAGDDDSGKGGSPGSGRRSRHRATIGFDDKDFDNLVHNEPAIAGAIVAVISVIFLAPVLAIGLILWYRFRKARMLSETMLQLAERGVVPPPEAMQALASGRGAPAFSTAPPLTATPASAALYEQARQLRKRAAWSDLRKGIVMATIGLGLVFYSMLDDGSPNGIGLVLLFLGTGYVVLWWFEERQLANVAGGVGGPAVAPRANGGLGSAPPGGPSTGA